MNPLNIIFLVIQKHADIVELFLTDGSVSCLIPEQILKIWCILVNQKHAAHPVYEPTERNLFW